MPREKASPEILAFGETYLNLIIYCIVVDLRADPLQLCCNPVPSFLEQGTKRSKTDIKVFYIYIYIYIYIYMYIYMINLGRFVPLSYMINSERFVPCSKKDGTG